MAVVIVLRERESACEDSALFHTYSHYAIYLRAVEARKIQTKLNNRKRMSHAVLLLPLRFQLNYGRKTDSAHI